MAEVVCCVLDLLDSAGQGSDNVFRAAYLASDDELAITIDSRLNVWSVALRDTY